MCLCASTCGSKLRRKREVTREGLRSCPVSGKGQPAVQPTLTSHNWVEGLGPAMCTPRSRLQKTVKNFVCAGDPPHSPLWVGKLCAVFMSIHYAKSQIQAAAAAATVPHTSYGPNHKLKERTTLFFRFSTLFYTWIFLVVPTPPKTHQPAQEDLWVPGWGACGCFITLMNLKKYRVYTKTKWVRTAAQLQDNRQVPRCRRQ